MKTNPNFISPCGLYCGVCAIYIAHRDNNHKFKERLANLYKGKVAGKGTLSYSENLSAEDIGCRGCLSDERFMHCRQCEIMYCTKEKGFIGCHQCTDVAPSNIVRAINAAQGKGILVLNIQHIADPQKGMAPFFNQGTDGAKIHPRILEAGPDAPL
jgi:Protein of unknown function (DUF3795)